MSIFAELDVFYDERTRTAAMNMALDEALLENASKSSVRFYRWDHPALSFGYFGKFFDVENHSRERDIVRRWTGGGIVFHGEDLTYSILIPAGDRAFGESSMSIYEKVHNAICVALSRGGQRAELAGVPALNSRPALANLRRGRRSTLNAQCFVNPVRSDVLLNGQKIAGAAQRRTRRGLLQQGSIQNVELFSDFEMSLAAELSENCREQIISDSVWDRAQEIAEQKYATAAWLRRR